MALVFNTLRIYRWAVGSGLAAMAVALLLAPAGGHAAGPSVTQAPTITGTPKVNQTLTAINGHWTGPPGTTAGYAWLRCSDDNVSHCSLLDNTNSTTYRVTNNDLNKKLRVSLWASARDSRGNYQWDYKVSDPTAFVTAAGTTPTPTPVATATATVPVTSATPTPTPVATPVPTPAPAFDVALPTATPVPSSGAVLHQTGVNKKARMLKPTPVVRIRGRLTANGANVTMMTVRAPKGSTVTVSCNGSGCPGRLTRSGGHPTRLAKLERVWRAGTRITVRVSRSGYVAKVTVITIRRGAAPARSDRCLYPGHKRTQKCPG